jgi:hypothetical protein
MNIGFATGSFKHGAHQHQLGAKSGSLSCLQLHFYATTMLIIMSPG